LEQDLGGINYGDPDLKVSKNAGTMEPHEVERLRAMMIEMVNKPGDFEQWLGRFATTPRHELDIAPAEPPYQPKEVLSTLNAGEKLIRLSGLRVMRIGDYFFVNSDGWDTSEIKGADALCQLTEVGMNELGEALENPIFVAELTEFINQGYWYFKE
ncbi:50S ribosomal protein L16 arginine hydroxylase, partial [Morganella morganii]